MKLSIMAALLAAVPLSGVGIALLRINEAPIRVAVGKLQIAVTDDIGNCIHGAFAEAHQGLDAIARTLTDLELDETTRVAIAMRLVEANPSLDHVSIYGADGKLIDTITQTSGEVVPALEVLPGSLRASVVPGSSRATGGGVELYGEEPRVLQVFPVEADGRITGYLASHVPLKALSLRIEHLVEAHFKHLPDPIIVADEQLRRIAGAPGSEGKIFESLADHPILRGIGAKVFAAGASASREFLGADGRTMVGAAVPLRDHGWVVLVAQPKDVAYGELSKFPMYIMVTVTVAIGIALFLAMMVSRRITAPLLDLTRFAGDLSARRFSRRVTINTQDELALLGRAMSTAAAELEESEARIKEEVAIRSDLGRYLPAELVDKVVRREQDMGLGGRRMQVTVLFADVVAFTPLTEKLAPEEVVALLNDLFTILTEIVFRHGGTVDKFVGDSVMAIWGAPTPQVDHASRALAAAEDMLRWLDIGNAGWRERFDTTIELAVGVNSGEVIVGNIGSESRMEYTAIGEVVNIAARLEAIAQPQQILVSDQTREAAGPRFEFIELGEKVVAGRTAPVRLFEVRV